MKTILLSLFLATLAFAELTNSPPESSWRLIHDGTNVIDEFSGEGVTTTIHTLFVAPTKAECDVEITRLGLTPLPGDTNTVQLVHNDAWDWYWYYVSKVQAYGGSMSNATQTVGALGYWKGYSVSNEIAAIVVDDKVKEAQFRAMTAGIDTDAQQMQFIYWRLGGPTNDWTKPPPEFIAP